jgi:hypothetical protein
LENRGPKMARGNIGLRQRAVRTIHNSSGGSVVANRTGRMVRHLLETTCDHFKLQLSNYIFLVLTELPVVRDESAVI